MFHIQSKNIALFVGALSVSLAAAFWAFEAIVLTPNLYNLPTLFVVFMLHAVPFLGMNIFFFSQYRYLQILPKTDWIYFFLLALMGGVLGTFFITKALFILDFKQLTIVALLQKLQPVFAILLARFFLKETISKQVFFWILLALSSSYFVTFGIALPDTEALVMQAAILAILAAFCYGSQTVLGKKVMTNVSPITGTFYRLGFTTLILGAYFIFQPSFYDHFAQITALNWQVFLLIGMSSSGLGLTLYYFGLKKIKASIASICEMSFVVTSVFLDYFIHGNLLSGAQIGAAVVLVFAIYQISASARSLEERQL
jgi:drug/metabolite transporter (DMT)-like permease